jgi:hypothetical protein
MWTSTFLLVVTAAFIIALALPSQLSAQQTQYKLIDLGPSTGLAVSVLVLCPRKQEKREKKVRCNAM